MKHILITGLRILDATVYISVLVAAAQVVEELSTN